MFSPRLANEPLQRNSRVAPGGESPACVGLVHVVRESSKGIGKRANGNKKGDGSKLRNVFVTVLMRERALTVGEASWYFPGALA